MSPEPISLQQHPDSILAVGEKTFKTSSLLKAVELLKNKELHRLFIAALRSSGILPPEKSQRSEHKSSPNSPNPFKSKSKSLFSMSSLYSSIPLRISRSYSPKVTNTEDSEEEEEKPEENLGENSLLEADWFGGGLECKLLIPGQKDWKKGRVRIRTVVEFEPEGLSSVSSDNPFDFDPLKDLRSIPEEDQT